MWIALITRGLLALVAPRDFSDSASYLLLSLCYVLLLDLCYVLLFSLCYVLVFSLCYVLLFIRCYVLRSILVIHLLPNLCVERFHALLDEALLATDSPPLIKSKVLPALTLAGHIV